MSMVNLINMKQLLRYVGVTICTACAFLILNISTAEAQTLVVPSDLTVECGGSLDPAVLGVATATDGCGATISSADISYVDDNAGLTLCGGTTGVIVRSWTASAPANCGGDLTGDQAITIEDTTPPVIKITLVFELDLLNMTAYSESGTIGLSLLSSEKSSIVVSLTMDFSLRFPDKIAKNKLLPKNRAAITAVNLVKKLAELLPVSIPEKLPPPIPPSAPPSLL